MTTKVKTEPNHETMTALDARRLLAQEQQSRVDACRAELEALLEKHQCRLDVTVLLRANSVTPQIQFVVVE